MTETPKPKIVTSTAPPLGYPMSPRSMSESAIDAAYDEIRGVMRCLGASERRAVLRLVNERFGAADVAATVGALEGMQ